MKRLVSGLSIVVPSLSRPRFGRYGKWYDHGDLIAFGAVFISPGVYGIDVIWQLVDGNQFIYRYGPWPQDIATILRDALADTYPYAGLIQGETYNFQIRPNLISKNTYP